ncbi:MAG TPA: DNA polymerase IV [Anaerolineae bacterium]|nr:DNA polymerase IV [Anaerolineae bacterium]HOQ99976.1 DNA polymerase IV [Anaerolineae bacterium]HPL29445.1 DNA polymerase IV [Anaerolineae bacterium]
MPTRSIIHLDLDAFFASVEELLDPAIAGKPVIVGGDPLARGVVSSASYAARAFGVRSAMPMGQALRLCPQAIVRHGHFAEYRRYSEQAMAILAAYTPLVEQISIDEAFLDVTGCERLWGEAPEIARTLQRRILDECRLPSSVGVATNKLVAKIASGLRKPRALVVVPAGEEASFLAPLRIEELWGVGEVAARRLHDLGLHTIGDLAAVPRETLIYAFGSYGAVLHEHAHGRDGSPVVTEGRRRSLSREETFARDVADEGELTRVLLRLSDEVAARLRRHGVQGRVVGLKLRTGDFVTLTRRATLPQPTDLAPAIYERARQLFRRAWKPGTPLRLLGVGVAGLVETPAYQLDLFGGGEQRWARLSQALDEIHARYGAEAIRRAAFLESDEGDWLEGEDGGG